jgi:hypothetical protein
MSALAGRSICPKAGFALGMGPLRIMYKNCDLFKVDEKKDVAILLSIVKFESARNQV